MGWELDAVDVCLEDVRGGTEDGGDFVGGDVLALPAEGVADAVGEEEAAFGVLAEEVARPVGWWSLSVVIRRRSAGLAKRATDLVSKKITHRYQASPLAKTSRKILESVAVGLPK